MEYVCCILPQGLQSLTVLKGSWNNSELLRTYFREEHVSGQLFNKDLFLVE